MSDSIFGNIASSLFNPISGIIGTIVSNKNSQRVANQNIAFQREMNNLLMDREDNAVQRRAFDLQKAGLSKTLAAGSPASASALTAPQNNYVPESVAKMLSKFNILDKINESRNLQTMVAKNKAEVDKIDSETTKNNITTAGLEQSFQFQRDLHFKEMNFIDSKISLLKTQNKLASIEGDYKASKLNAEINSILANTKLTEKNINLKSEQIASEVVKRNNLNWSTKKLLSDLVIMNYNLNYSKTTGTPYGQQVQGKFGGFINAMNSSNTILNNIAYGGGYNGSLGSLYGEPDFNFKDF